MPITDPVSWEDKKVTVETVKIEHQMSVKMRNILMKMAVAAYADLDTYIDEGDTEPTYISPDVAWDPDRGAIRVIEGDRRFVVNFGVTMR